MSFTYEIKTKLSNVECTFGKTETGHEIGYCNATGPCDFSSYEDKLTDFKIQFAKTVYTIPPEMMAYEENGYCWISVRYNEAISNGIVYIGQPFLQTFAAMFDYELGVVLFAQNAQAKAGAAIYAPPDDSDPGTGGLSGWAKFGIFVLVVVILVLIYGVFHVMFRQSRRRQMQHTANTIAY